MSPDEKWADLTTRLEYAARTLAANSDNTGGDRSSHLDSKAQGVRLALSYMREYDRSP